MNVLGIASLLFGVAVCDLNVAKTKECGQLRCGYVEFCSPIDNSCKHCSKICDEGHNQEIFMCNEHCQGQQDEPRVNSSLSLPIRFSFTRSPPPTPSTSYSSCRLTLVTHPKHSPIRVRTNDKNGAIFANHREFFTCDAMLRSRLHLYLRSDV